MWSYVFHLFRRQPGKSVLAGSGFLLAACALILLSATTQTTVVRANQILSQNWRPSYDLVVLPAQAHIPSYGVIPNDFLEGYDGGISNEQYQQIKGLPGIAVAAPIAFVGYVQMPVPRVAFSTQTLPDGFYELDWTLAAFNGQHQIVESRERSFFYHLSDCDTDPGQLNLTVIGEELNKHGILLDCTSSSAPISQFSTVDTGTFLLAAIDPSEEDQLVHLNKSITSGRILTSQDDLHPDPNPDIDTISICQLPTSSCLIPNLDIPVLFDTQLPGQIMLNGSFARLATGISGPQSVVERGGAAYLAHLSPQQTIFQGNVPLVQNDPQRFSAHQLVWDGQSWQPYGSGGDPTTASLKFLYAASGLTYQRVSAPAGQSTPAYALVPHGVQGPEAAFRTLKPLHIAEINRPTEPYYGAYAYSLPSAFYFFDTIGEFSGDTLNAQFSNPLNWLPENTYTAPPTILRYNAQGQPVTPTTLVPTTNHAGFLLQPPLALTTLSAAAQLRGNNIISAIRVRVSGVNTANPASWQRVQQAAALIEQRTHLHVLVTLGSSPRPTLVYVPGVKQGEFGATQNIAPVGWVEEPWIAIGASILYITQVRTTQLLLLGAVLLVCLGYLVVAFSTLMTAQRRDFAILSALGWPPWQPARLLLTQALLLGLGGGILGLGIALFATALLGITPLWSVMIGTVPMMLVLAFLGSLYPLWQLWQIQPAEILRAGSLLTFPRMGQVSLWSWVSPLESLALRNLARTRLRSGITIVSLFVSAMLLAIMVNGSLTLSQTLSGTLLGQFVLLRTTAPLIAGGVLAVFFSLLNVADLLLLQVQERQQEIGVLLAVGWRVGMVQRLFLREGITLALISTLPGVLLAQGIMTIQHTAQNSILSLLVDIGAILLIALVSILAAIPALRVMSRVQVVTMLRAA
jgi:ABC-type lipoprotein release transport system permease subunit